MSKRDTIRAHCTAHHIRIIERPGGLVRFVGHEIDVSYSAWEYVTLSDLRRFDPPPKRQARAGMTA
jgi:hypothetical protein